MHVQSSTQRHSREHSMDTVILSELQFLFLSHNASPANVKKKKKKNKRGKQKQKKNPIYCREAPIRFLLLVFLFRIVAIWSFIPVIGCSWYVSSFQLYISPALLH